MNTLEIKRYLEKNEDTRNIFLNVYAVDQLPKRKIEQERWLLVCNCCPANKRGEHWIAMFYENEELEFFDSFGLSPEDYDGVTEFLLAQKPKDIIFNTIQLQSDESDACGHYCILYGLHRSRGETFHTIIKNMNELNRDDFIKFIVSVL